MKISEIIKNTANKVVISEQEKIKHAYTNVLNVFNNIKNASKSGPVVYCEVSKNDLTTLDYSIYTINKKDTEYGNYDFSTLKIGKVEIYIPYNSDDLFAVEFSQDINDDNKLDELWDNFINELSKRAK